ncbi:hypothetical protein IAR55_003115 [Kwoniella newhampshirensis]|uniref:Uncharacterized protein n=1 Tax=Kwoniella newhampshirensis TaxID=1651941 RepID=A0AAW0YZS4_9TREE
MILETYADLPTLPVMPRSPESNQARTALHMAITEQVLNLIETCASSSPSPTSPHGLTLIVETAVEPGQEDDEEEVESTTAAGGSSSQLDRVSLFAEASTRLSEVGIMPDRGRSRAARSRLVPVPLQTDEGYFSRRKDAFNMQRGELESKIGSWSESVCVHALAISEDYPEIPDTIPSPSIPYTYILRTSPPIIGSTPAPFPSLTLYENLASSPAACDPSTTPRVTTTDMNTGGMGLGLTFSPKCSSATFRPGRKASGSLGAPANDKDKRLGERGEREWLLNLLEGGDWEDKKDIRESRIAASKVEVVEGMPTPRPVAATGGILWG